MLASIFGFEVKNVRSFTGHDGPGYLQGTLYYAGKRIGTWSQDAWCGPDHFFLDTGHEEEYYENIAKKAYHSYLNNKGSRSSHSFHLYESPYWSLETLMMDLCTLKELESLLKKGKKQGYGCLIRLVNLTTHADVVGYLPTLTKENVRVFTNLHGAKVDNNYVVELYTKLADFKVAVPVLNK